MADSIWVSILSGGFAGAATGALASVSVAYLKERFQRRRDRLEAAAALHSKIEEVPQLVRALQRAGDPPTHPVDSMDRADYYAAKERTERAAAETLDHALAAIVNSARRIGPKYVTAATQVRDAARLATSAADGAERQSRNHALELVCEHACTVGFK